MATIPNRATHFSLLLYACYLQGDGNFYLQQKSTAPSRVQNPLMILDRGFWPTQGIFDQHVASRKADVSTRDVSATYTGMLNMY